MPHQEDDDTGISEDDDSSAIDATPVRGSLGRLRLQRRCRRRPPAQRRRSQLLRRPGRWFGREVASAGDVNGDGFADVLVGAPCNISGSSCAVDVAYLDLGP